MYCACQARNFSSALSAANAICDHVSSWIHGSPRGEWVSMGVISDGSYGVPEGLMYSFPVTCKGGKWKIVQGKKQRLCHIGCSARVLVCVD